jgi:hypothetical protein
MCIKVADRFNKYNCLYSPQRKNCFVMSCSFLLLIVPARAQYMVCGCTNTVRLCVSTTGLKGKIKFIVLRII